MLDVCESDVSVTEAPGLIPLRQRPESGLVALLLDEFRDTVESITTGP